MLKTLYFKELEGYDYSDILNKLDNNENIFNKLLQSPIFVSDGEECKFQFVGIIIIEDFVINCYPKYVPENIADEKIISDVFGQVLRVLRKYKKSKKEDFSYKRGNLDEESFNLVSLMLFFIEDYYENGVYTNIKNILEINGNGEINWDKTINDTFPLIENEEPYYTELYTRYKLNNLYDYFRVLHECIITECSNFLEDANLLDFFDLTPIELSDKTLEDLGDKDFILNKIEKQLKIEFNTHKQKLLKSMHSYISLKDVFTNEKFLICYGKKYYAHVWEEMCSKVFDNKLDEKLGELGLDIDFDKKYKPEVQLKALIEKPKWKSEGFTKKPDNTFIPDVITFDENRNFIILDAKYYNLVFEKEKELKGPGIEDIAKQYFYELAFKEFLDKNKCSKEKESLKDNCKCIKGKKNALLFPIYGSRVINKGYIELEMLSSLGLENIQVIMLPAEKMNSFYLGGGKMDISDLKLDKYYCPKGGSFNKIGKEYCVDCEEKLNENDDFIKKIL